MTDTDTKNNPFFIDWTQSNEYHTSKHNTTESVNLGIPPFELIKEEHYIPAIKHGIKLHAEEIDAIANDKAKPTFANTIAKIEASGRFLSRVMGVYSNLQVSNPSEKMHEISNEVSSLLSQHGSKVSMNPKIFERVKHIYENCENIGLAEDQLRLVEDHYKALMKSGAGAEDDVKEKLAEINEKLATLKTTFNQNVLKDESNWELGLSKEDLEGLPESLVEILAENAKERESESPYLLTLSMAVVDGFLTHSSKRDLREKLWKAWKARGDQNNEYDNNENIRQILDLEAQKAKLLGYANYAEYNLENSMAQTVDNVFGLLDDVWKPAKTKAEDECEKLSKMAQKEGMNEDIQPWDWSYYSEKVRKEEYDLDDTIIKNYFTLESVTNAAFECAERLFGVVFNERPDIKMYHPDVKVYEVTYKTGQHAGIFIADNYARSNKRSGAWMSTFMDGESFEKDYWPIVINNTNFAKANPTLLGFEEARTLFHEFGHGLHALLSIARYPSQSGTAVKRDFVEFPSQIFEEWLMVPEILEKYAKHYKTGEVLPKELLQKILEAKDFNQGFATVEYCASAYLDIMLYSDNVSAEKDVRKLEQEILAHLEMPKGTSIRHRPQHFKHIFGGGYASGYYSYLWADASVADASEAFDEKKDWFDPELSERLLEIYQAGDTAEPMDLYIALRGREPDPKALLRKRGLI